MTGSRVEVRLAAPGELAEPLALLEESLRDGEPVPPPFVEQVRRAVERRDIEVLVARVEARPAGVAVISFRLNVSMGTLFASVEDLYVEPRSRGQGLGRRLLDAVGERCRARGVSYVEVQTDDEAAGFYRAAGYLPETGVRMLSRSYAL